LREKELNPMNDHHFLQALSCPLKIHYLNVDRKSNSPRDYFRQRNKLHLRDAVAIRFSEVRHTSNDIDEAKKETEKWLQESEVAICGAVIQHDEYLTRIPILIKSSAGLSIIQIHGKLRKRTLETINIEGRLGKSVMSYLVKAAYRYEVVKRVFPDKDINVEFYFPGKDFRSGIDLLHLHRIDKFRESDEFSEELQKLFVAMDATDAVRSVVKQMPSGVGYYLYDSLSMKEILEKISESEDRSVQSKVGRIHGACSFCDYRRGSYDESGCWEEHFKPQDVVKGNMHVYELIGHGSNRDLENNQYFQEEITIHDGLHSFDLMTKFGGPNITIQQRRNLQILRSKGEVIPRLWVKGDIDVLNRLEFPLHFIDFEAATYSLPMRRGSYPYEPVYFQFSCHTLFSDGSLNHTEWLDVSSGENFPHDDFTEAIGRIPEIERGTLVHYSPFEKQALNNLIRGYERNSMLNEERLNRLKRIRDGLNGEGNDRFFDLSKVIRDSYFNKYMSNGLGLKEVLNSILLWERSSKQKTLTGLEHPASMEVLLKDRVDPYSQIQTGSNLILDGSSAMNAWINFKCGLIQEEEKNTVLNLLKRYCELDSYSMVVLYHHLVHLYKMRENDEGEIIF